MDWKCRWWLESSAGRPRWHPGAKAALKLMGVKTAAELAEIIVSVGLAQNLAALRALATEGIQKDDHYYSLVYGMALFAFRAIDAVANVVIFLFRFILFYQDALRRIMKFAVPITHRY
jgi:hypothetical protein